MRRAVAAMGMLALAACPGRGAKNTPVIDQGAGTESDLARRMRLIAELQDEILTSYERDELPEVDTLMIPPEIGPAWIGVGPGDAYFGDAVRRFVSSRLPLQVEPGTPTVVRSKRLQIHLSNDRAVTAAWMSDELSWRITLCNRAAVIPLRVTALYAHDGDRWVQVFEHMSFGRMPMPTVDGELRGAKIVEAVIDRELSDTLSRQLNGLLSAQSTRVELTVASGTRDAEPTKPAPTFLLAPDPDSEWSGYRNIEQIRLIDGKVTLDERRVGTLNRPDKATIAYWVGNLIADLRHHPGTPGSKVQLRGTFIFEKRENKWVIVQGHISQPIDDIDLAQIVYGTALISEKPLQITCDDGRRSIDYGSAAARE